MRAVLLAAGLGTRLRPLTDTTPKCLVPIHGVPLLAAWLHWPVAASQASSVHGLLSLQFWVAPAHAPSTQVSALVQATPSSQLPPLCAANAHLPALQVLLVQAFLSSQSVSLLQAAPQVAIAVNTQPPLLASHVSVVQALPSSQPLAAP